MTITSLSRRLEKVEVKRPLGISVFMVWGRTLEEATNEAASLRAAGTMNPHEAATIMVWPDPDPLPVSRRIWFREGLGGEPDISDRELELLVAALGEDEAELAEGDVL